MYTPTNTLFAYDLTGDLIAEVYQTPGVLRLRLSASSESSNLRPSRDSLDEHFVSELQRWSKLADETKEVNLPGVAASLTSYY